MKMLDDEMKRTDALLYQMIPKPVADRLRSGEPSVDTCQVSKRQCYHRGDIKFILRRIRRNVMTSHVWVNHCILS